MRAIALGTTTPTVKRTVVAVATVAVVVTGSADVADVDSIAAVGHDWAVGLSIIHGIIELAPIVEVWGTGSGVDVSAELEELERVAEGNM